MKILSIFRETIKHNNYQHLLRFHIEFNNEYNNLIETLYLFTCLCYENKPLLYGISQDPNYYSVNKWCTLIKEVMNEKKGFLLILELSEIVDNYINQELID